MLLSRVTAKAPGWTPNDAGKFLSTYAIDNFTLPGDPGFPLNQLYAPPASRLDAGSFPTSPERMALGNGF